MEKNHTLFESLKYVINDYFLISSNRIITRKYIIEELKKIHNFHPYSYDTLPDKNLQYYSLNTLDNFRNMLEKTGYLSKVFETNKIKFGVFKINRKIPESLTSHELRNLYDNRPYEFLIGCLNNGKFENYKLIQADSPENAVEIYFHTYNHIGINHIAAQIDIKNNWINYLSDIIDKSKIIDILTNEFGMIPSNVPTTFKNLLSKI